MKRTLQQNKWLHKLLQENDLMDRKRFLVYTWTDHRTAHSSEMSYDECQRLIEHLENLTGRLADQSNQMRRKIFAICYQLGWISTPYSQKDKMVNKATIDNFLKSRGYIKKPLIDFTYSELVKLVSQFEQIQKHYDKSEHNKAVSALLDELNIPVTHKV